MPHTHTQVPLFSAALRGMHSNVFQQWHGFFHFMFLPKNLPQENPQQRYTVHKDNDSNSNNDLAIFWIKSQCSNKINTAVFVAADLTKKNAWHNGALHHSDFMTKRTFLLRPVTVVLLAKAFIGSFASGFHGSAASHRELESPTELNRHPKIFQVKGSILRKSDTPPPKKTVFWEFLRVILDLELSNF